ncbi:MAG: Crp/Fnr family transcriptional regulator [Terracidiphilus sp.]
MATCYAPMTNMSPRIPLGRTYPMPSVVRPAMKLVPGQSSSLPKQDNSISSQSPLSRFMVGKSRRDYQLGESIFSQGDPSSAVFYIESGKVKLTVVSMSGKEAVIAHLSANSFFGEASLTGEMVRSASAYALEPSSILRIDKRTMQDLLHHEPEFAEQFLNYLLARNTRIQADLVDHLFNSSEKRLARLLMMMANFGQDSKPIPVITKISQETLAEMIGTTRSRVSFFLNRFRELGYIDYNSVGILIHSSLVNVVLHD